VAKYYNFDWFGDEVRKKINSNSRKGMVKGLEFIKQESVKVVPKDTGLLEKSAGIKFNKNQASGKHEGVVFYDTPYAIRQHEELNFRHAEGRIAKYLELPFQQNQMKALQIIQREINKGMK
tara:strand:- start:535 stop:897 length:363 start_codon:yes stop_codon:yes gene_type:complete